MLTLCNSPNMDNIENFRVALGAGVRHAQVSVGICNRKVNIRVGGGQER